MDVAAVGAAVGALTLARLRRSLDELGLVASLQATGERVQITLDLPEGLGEPSFAEGFLGLVPCP